MATGFCNEMTEDEVAAAVLWQATLRVPIRVVPREREIANAILLGEHLFDEIGCASCHVPELPLEDSTYSEPNPFNPPGNLQLDGGDPVIRVDLTDDQLPSPRLRARGGSVMVAAYTDLRLHDIPRGPGDPNCEPLDQNAAGTIGFTAGNCRFLTKRLWGAGNEPPFFHHGQFTTLRRAILNHFGEADTKPCRAAAGMRRSSSSRACGSGRPAPHPRRSTRTTRRGCGRPSIACSVSYQTGDDGVPVIIGRTAPDGWPGRLLMKGAGPPGPAPDFLPGPTAQPSISAYWPSFHSYMT